uniref:Fe2OG dioxygenase domain-containing protein n=1 Tax=Plectus sambesii TaxID=2011161 RepID=A0A914VTG7_9BILA
MVDAYSGDAAPDSPMSAFKRAFKYYKSRNPPPDMSTVWAMDESDVGRGVRISPLPTSIHSASSEQAELGLNPIDQWTVATIDSKPGIMLLRGVFRPESHLYWLDRCLRAYPEAPNVTNLDAHSDQKLTQIWRGGDLNRLRWTTLGYHYDWLLKEYRDESRSPFPSDLDALSRTVAAAAGFDGFTPETAIVNYYPPKSTLSGHVDRAERDLDQPLLSFSFGQTAIYLSGGTSLDEEPTPMFLRSGDVLILYGDQRLVNHAVPRVFAERPFSDSAAFDPIVVNYANSNRVNITVRQVNVC